MWEPSYVDDPYVEGRIEPAMYGDPYVEWNEENDARDERPEEDEGDMEETVAVQEIPTPGHEACDLDRNCTGGPYECLQGKEAGDRAYAERMAGEPKTPGALILRNENIVLAACAHWWQVPTVQVEGASGLPWAPLAHCRECELDGLALACLDSIRAMLRRPIGEPAAVLLEVRTLVETAALELPHERHDSYTRAVVSITSWDEGTTNERTRHLAQCRKATGCPLPTGHRGPCGERPPGDVSASPAAPEPLLQGYRAYAAYAAYMDWKSARDGEPLPAWNDLDPDTREAWHLGALASGECGCSAECCGCSE
jgi:hypothetical protein